MKSKKVAEGRWLKSLGRWRPCCVCKATVGSSASKRASAVLILTLWRSALFAATESATGSFHTRPWCNLLYRLMVPFIGFQRIPQSVRSKRHAAGSLHLHKSLALP